MTRLSNHSHSMAHGFLNRHDADPGTDDDVARWSQNCQDDWQGLRARDSTDRLLLQFELDMRKQGLLVPVGGVHPDAQGTET